MTADFFASLPPLRDRVPPRLIRRRPKRRMADDFPIHPPNEAPRRVTADDAAIIKGMLKRGDNQHHIAARFGTNGGRICEINKGYRFPDVEPAPAHLLPAPGPVVPPSPAVPPVSWNGLPPIVEVSSIAEEVRRAQQQTREDVAAVNQKLDHVLRQLAGFGRRIGLIEDPRTPRLSRRRPLES